MLLYVISSYEAKQLEIEKSKIAAYGRLHEGGSVEDVAHQIDGGDQDEQEDDLMGISGQGAASFFGGSNSLNVSEVKPKAVNFASLG